MAPFANLGSGRDSRVRLSRRWLNPGRRTLRQGAGGTSSLYPRCDKGSHRSLPAACGRRLPLA
jgi:hypothetical protein